MLQVPNLHLRDSGRSRGVLDTPTSKLSENITYKQRIDPDPGLHQLLPIFSEPTGTSKISHRLLKTPRMLSECNFEARNEFSNSKKHNVDTKLIFLSCLRAVIRQRPESIFDPILDLLEPQKLVMVH